MPVPRLLPNLQTIEEDFRVTALWLNRVLYTAIIAYTVLSLLSIFLSGPDMAEKQLPTWGAMPQLTLCLDNSTATFLQSAGFVAQGFGHRQQSDALSGDCTEGAAKGDSDASRWVNGSALEGSEGRCHRLDLARLYPFAGGTKVNNLMIGGIADYHGGLFPRFIAVGASEGPSDGYASTLSNPLLYLYPQRFLVDELGRPTRIQSPSYVLDKQRVPRDPLPWLLDSAQDEQYSVRNMGLWKSCVPMQLQKGLRAGQIVFGFGIFITSPEIRSVYSVGVVWRVSKLIGSVGGWCGISLIIWRCIFVRPHGASWPTDQEKRTLHPRLKGWHAAVHRHVEGLLGSSAAAREMEEPFVH
mmetsp:Transcript_2674/g.8295  ORF Transcript_2674/g.8295 Transcript_2674/m.8295 type:complete len:355 (-) Transcript_2674:124-1188(-)